MKIYLCAREEDLFNAWRLYCGHYPFVEPTKQDIMAVKAEAIVSPANSFGFMTGGIDLHYRNYFGKEVEKDLQKRIALLFNNELLVGQATTIKIDPKPAFTYRWLIAAPTMRVPENVSHTINAFLAAKAALMEAVKVGVESIVFPGLGTGTGGLTAEDCGKQMNAAIDYVFVSKRAYAVPGDLYEESLHMRKHIVSKKWMEVQAL